MEYSLYFTCVFVQATYFDQAPETDSEASYTRFHRAGCLDLDVKENATVGVSVKLIVVVVHDVSN